jgi:hypothetical protein
VLFGEILNSLFAVEFQSQQSQVEMNQRRNELEDWIRSRIKTFGIYSEDQYRSIGVRFRNVGSTPIDEFLLD